MSSTSGAVFVARERQELEAEPPASPGPSRATATLAEIAAAHDGQPPATWLDYFRKQFAA